jgi:HPt (histidine-containing phosphotransfer) domain-containing protein
VEGLRRAAHSVKSTAASFGASHLSSLAFKLEGMAKASNLEVGDLLADLQSAFEQAADELKGLRP